MKKICLILLSAALILSLSGCGGDPGESSGTGPASGDVSGETVATLAEEPVSATEPETSTAPEETSAPITEPEITQTEPAASETVTSAEQQKTEAATTAAATTAVTTEKKKETTTEAATKAPETTTEAPTEAPPEEDVPVLDGSDDGEAEEVEDDSIIENLDEWLLEHGIDIGGSVGGE